MQRLRVDHVTEGKGAYLAGVKKHDVIESFNGKTITSNENFSFALSSVTGNGTLDVIRRDGLHNLTITTFPMGVTTTVIEFDPDNFEESCITDPDERQRRETEKKKRLIDQMIVTTTQHIDGFKVDKYLDVVSAECVFGMNILSDIFAAFSDVFGGRSGTSQNALRKAKENAIFELKQEALSAGANAVIGISLDYSEISGQGKSMLFIVATGTAVVIKAE